MQQRITKQAIKDAIIKALSEGQPTTTEIAYDYYLNANLGPYPYVVKRTFLNYVNQFHAEKLIGYVIVSRGRHGACGCIYDARTFAKLLENTNVKVES